MNWFLNRKISERWAIVFITTCLALAAGLLTGTLINDQSGGRTPTESAPPTTPPSSEAGVGGRPHSPQARPSTRLTTPKWTRTPYRQPTPKRTPSRTPTATHSPSRRPTPTPDLTSTFTPPPGGSSPVSPPADVKSGVQWKPERHPVPQTAMTIPD